MKMREIYERTAHRGDSSVSGRKLSVKIRKLRKMTTEDLFPLYHVPSDSEVMEYLEPPFSMEAAKQFLYKAGICETPLIWAVEDARKVFIGYVIYHTYDETSMELGWVLDRKEWGKGY